MSETKSWYQIQFWDFTNKKWTPAKHVVVKGGWDDAVALCAGMSRDDHGSKFRPLYLGRAKL